MSAKEGIKRYRETGGAADLVRVEVLVPKSRRDEIVNAAAELRSAHRAEKARLMEFIRIATERYGLTVFDNIDIEKLDDLAQKARIVANALMERGDARAYAMGRKMASKLERGADGTDANPEGDYGLYRRKSVLYGSSRPKRHQNRLTP